jgi:hypothetical protein
MEPHLIAYVLLTVASVARAFQMRVVISNLGKLLSQASVCATLAGWS